ncbi:alpha/beta fold hydrolase [Pseudonocardia sp. GCM10023141]|uniref:alpha/beta fold hydrolase n=1 Tax=Pseudonocardia sp. GCM10023141 TaxID=3252653 RepID=UPI003611B173
MEEGVELRCYVDDFLWPWQTATPVLLSHGMSRNALFWDPWIPWIARKYRVYRPDWRGQGDSYKPPPGYVHDYREGARDALALMDHLGLERVHFVGEASGGMIGCTLAQMAPGRLASIVLCDTPLRPVPESHKEPERDFIMSAGVRKWHLDTIGQRLDPVTAPAELVDWYGEQMAKTPPDVAAAIIEGSDHFLDEPITTLPVPILILVGDRNPDRVAEQREVSSLLPKGHLGVVSGHAKGIFTLAPDDCARQALAFWDALDQT